MAESLHILLGTSACLQWLCHSGERTVACGPLVFVCVFFSDFVFLNPTMPYSGIKLAQKFREK